VQAEADYIARRSRSIESAKKSNRSLSSPRKAPQIKKEESLMNEETPKKAKQSKSIDLTSLNLLPT
jgi:hypothetical protein